MRERLRSLAFPTLLSVLLHAAPLGAMRVWQKLQVFEPPIPIEILPPRARPRPAPPPAPPTPPPPEKKVAKAKAKGTGPGARKPTPPAPPVPPAPPPPPPPATVDVGPLGPEDARVVIVLRTDRIRRTVHRQGVEALLQALPDYRTLLDGTGLSPVGDIDALLVATSDPRSVTATFLAARHPDDPVVHEALARRTFPSWDPRKLRFIDGRLTILAQPDEAARLDAALQAGLTPDGGVDGGDQAMVWLTELRRFEQLAEEEGSPVALVTFRDLGALARFGGGMPTPQQAMVAVSSDASPAVRVQVTFATEEEATAFLDAWPDIIKRWKGSTRMLGLGPMLDGLAVKRTGTTVEAEGRIAEAHVRLALSWVEAVLPKPQLKAPPAELVGPPSPVPAFDAAVRRDASVVRDAGVVSDGGSGR